MMRSLHHQRLRSLWRRSTSSIAAADGDGAGVVSDATANETPLAPALPAAGTALADVAPPVTTASDRRLPHRTRLCPPTSDGCGDRQPPSLPAWPDVASHQMQVRCAASSRYRLRCRHHPSMLWRVRHQPSPLITDVARCLRLW